MIGIALQLAVSLIAIVLLTLFAQWLGLGRDVRLRDPAEAQQLAQAAVCGFDPVDIALDRAGIGALLRDEQGRVLLLRRHGAHFASRMIDSHAGARLDRNLLTITTDDPQFGSVTLDLGTSAPVWAGSFRRLGA